MPDQDDPTAPPEQPEPTEPAAEEPDWKEGIRAAAGIWADRPRDAVSPPTIDPKRWEDFPTFRESFLRWFTDPAHNAALRAFGTLLFEMVLEANRVFPDEPESFTRHDLRAAVADLRYLQGFLGYIGSQQEDMQPEEDREDMRLSKLAAKLAPRVGRIADAIEGALG